MIAQLFSECLGACLKSFFPNGTIDVDAYIDNIRILAHDLVTLKSALIKLYALCEVYKVDINESLSDVLKQNPEEYDFLGAHYDHRNGTTTITEKLRGKLHSAFQFFSVFYPRRRIEGTELSVWFRPLVCVSLILYFPLSSVST